MFNKFVMQTKATTLRLVLSTLTGGVVPFSETRVSKTHLEDLKSNHTQFYVGHLNYDILPILWNVKNAETCT